MTKKQIESTMNNLNGWERECSNVPSYYNATNQCTIRLCDNFVWIDIGLGHISLTYTYEMMLYFRVNDENSDLRLIWMYFNNNTMFDIAW